MLRGVYTYICSGDVEERLKFLLTLATLANPPIHNGLPLTLSSNSTDSLLNSATTMHQNMTNQRMSIFKSVSSGNNELITNKSHPIGDSFNYIRDECQLLPVPGSVTGMVAT